MSMYLVRIAMRDECTLQCLSNIGQFPKATARGPGKLRQGATGRSQQGKGPPEIWALAFMAAGAP